MHTVNVSIHPHVCDILIAMMGFPRNSQKFPKLDANFLLMIHDFYFQLVRVFYSQTIIRR